MPSVADLLNPVLTAPDLDPATLATARDRAPAVVFSEFGPLSVEGTLDGETVRLWVEGGTLHSSTDGWPLPALAVAVATWDRSPRRRRC